MVHKSVQDNSNHSIHAFSTTTFDDIMQSFSNVSVIRVAVGYLLMVRTLNPSDNDSLKTLQLLILDIISVAGLRLPDLAKVGLHQIPGGGGASWGAINGSVGGCRTGSLLPAGPLLQCCHHPGIKLNAVTSFVIGTIAALHSGPFSSSGTTLSSVGDRRGRHVSIGSLLPRDWERRPRRGILESPLISSSVFPHLFSSERYLALIWKERTGNCLRRSGTSVALTSINNMTAFFMAALVPIPGLRVFSLQVCSPV